MVRISTFLTALTAVSGVSASLARARRALEERQSSNAQPNAVQNWKNDYATVDFKTGANGLFSADWKNGPGGNFVVGRGWNPARDMSVFPARTHCNCQQLTNSLPGWSTTQALSRPTAPPTSPSTAGLTTHSSNTMSSKPWATTTRPTMSAQRSTAATRATAAPTKSGKRSAPTPPRSKATTPISSSTGPSATPCMSAAPSTPATISAPGRLQASSSAPSCTWTS
jgi:hypothetical protein